MSLFKIVKNLLIHVVVYGLALFLVHTYSPGWFWVEATRYDAILTFVVLAVLFWLINNIVKGILNILTLPLKYLTFGLSSLVLNVVLIYIFEYIVNGLELGVIVHVGGLLYVLMLSLVFSFLAFLIKRIR